MWASATLREIRCARLRTASCPFGAALMGWAVVDSRGKVLQRVSAGHDPTAPLVMRLPLAPKVETVWVRGGWCASWAIMPVACVAWAVAFLPDRWALPMIERLSF